MNVYKNTITLAELTNAARFEGIVLVRSAEIRVSQAGKKYMDMNVSDCTGTMNAKMWDASVPPPPIGSVVRIRATGNEYNGRMQLRLEKVDLLKNDDPIDWNSLVPSAPEDPHAMLAEIKAAADAIPDTDYALLTTALLERSGEKVLTFPAAKQMHHAERSGLLHHTVSMLRATKALLPVYPQLNASLLLAGVIVHDLGKIEEMDADDMGVVSDYSLDGKLIGHIIRGVINIEEVGKSLSINPDKVRLLQHMVLSHHGIPDYGSPKQPMLAEAEFLHLIDTLDARLYEMQDAISHTLPGAFSEKIWGLDNRQIYRIPLDNT
ncbi:MAG: HD domain-containing protein [Clostridia bacterium]|nr:HD domain-containing protein [Clostridia bacterium]